MRKVGRSSRVTSHVPQKRRPCAQLGMVGAHFPRSEARMPANKKGRPLPPLLSRRFCGC